MTIPDEHFYDPTPSVDKNRPPIRTKEDVHVCGDVDSESDESDDGNPFPSPSPSPRFFSGSQMSPCLSSTSCHTHSLEYVTAPSPADLEMFGRLRNAVIRSFTGEMLPRGEKAGPFWFGGDSGFTIGYKFELSDDFARGTRRSYALLALAGHDQQRALAAATVLWALFEQIALNITRTAQEVSARIHPEEDGSPPEEELEELMRRPGVSSFLTGRGAMGGLGRMMHDRRSGIDQKPTSIADLVENERFFCELHMVFVSILQELGRTFGGMQVRNPDEGEVVEGQVTNVTVPSNKQVITSKKADDWSHPAYPPTPTSMSSSSAMLRESTVVTDQRQVVM